MDDLAALRLQIEWGADEALLAAPSDRFVQPSRPTRVANLGPPSPATHAAVNPTPVRPAAAANLADVRPSPPKRPAISVPSSAGPALAALAAQLAAEAVDLAALHAAMDSFEACPLRHTASTTVAPSGNPAADLVLIGEAPGPDDDRSGQAFSGPAGDRVDRILASAGLGRDQLLLALMVPWRPPGGRPVSQAELALCLPFLHRLLALVRPRHLVLMGAGPYRTFLGEDGGFRRARGKWSCITRPGVDPLPALTMLPPDGWLSSAASKQATWTDLLALRSALIKSA